MRGEAGGRPIRPHFVALASLLTLGGAVWTPSFQLPLIAVNIVWSLIFAVPVALACGWRGGLLVGLFGAAPIPFLLWPNNGWANLAGAGQYLVWLTWLGWCAGKRERGAGLWSHPLVAQLAMLPVYALVFLVLFPLLLSFNPAPWEERTVSSVPVEILQGLVVKDAFGLYLCLLGGICLLKLPPMRRFLGLETPDCYRLNGLIVGSGLTAFFILWLILVALDNFLIGGLLPTGLPLPSSPFELISLFVILIACLGTAVATCSFSEYNLTIAAKLGASQASLRATLLQLQATNVEMERLTTVAAHDLQEPVRSVVSFSQMLEQRYKPLLDGPGQEYLGFIVGGAKRMKALVAALHEYSNLIHKVIDFWPVSMQRLVEEVAGGLRRDFKDIPLRMEIQNLPDVQGDREHLRLLFHHLLHNALKFRRDGQEVCVLVTARERKDGFWEFAVKDNGIGIAQESQARVFDAFRQLHQAGRFPGVGIGLALARLIVHEHGGQIWVASGEPGRTELRLTLSKDPAGKNVKSA
ncbi:MAG: ATP-binding protein [Rhodospirillales bacterium]|nr:ATP-binding protein [Rhodospirillales bacterium]